MLEIGDPSQWTPCLLLSLSMFCYRCMARQCILLKSLPISTTRKSQRIDLWTIMMWMGKNDCLEGGQTQIKSLKHYNMHYEMFSRHFKYLNIFIIIINGSVTLLFPDNPNSNTILSGCPLTFRFTRSRDYTLNFTGNVILHWLDCSTGPGCVHSCSCICGGIVLSHSGTHHLTESAAACAGHMLPGGRERKSVFNQ